MNLLALSDVRIPAAALFVACQLVSPALAQGQPPSAGPSYPGQSDITFEWDYSCTRRTCSFTCPDGGASHVTKLTIYLGTIPVGNLRNTPAMIYNFSTV